MDLSNIDLTSGLNDKQSAAVKVLSGPLLILAGAGSGKTKTLTHRIANLIKHGTKPSQILAVTFTNKASKEMKDRISALLGGKVSFPYMGTFHGVCVRILRTEYLSANLPRDFVIYDTDDQQTLIKRLIKQFDYDPKTLKPKMVLSIISKNKTSNVSPSEYTATAYYPQQKQIAKLYEAYESTKSQSGVVDFDDLLLLVEQLFDKNPEVLSRWQDKIKHILVDEYQDTNHTQYSIIKALAEKTKNICVVGDDWQSIYSWRGADYTNILNFDRDFKDTTVIKLEQNYRSTGNILDVSQRVINENSTRLEKNLFTDSEAGDPVQVYQARDELDEANFIASKIQSFTSSFYQESSQLSSDRTSQKTFNYSDIAILYRTNAQSYAFEKAFIGARIPYKLVGGMRFYDRREIKDVLAILKLILNPSDWVSLERVIKNVISGIGEASFQKLLLAMNGRNSESNPAPKAFYDEDIISTLPPRIANKLDSIGQFIKSININTPPGDIIKSVIEYFNFLDLLANDPATAEERTKNLEVMIGNANEYQSLSDFISDSALMSSTDDVDNSNVVTLSTMHASKGLEFPIVFIVGMEEGLFPSPQAELDGNIEEERRLAYVGMTRAMCCLFLTYARSRFSFGGRSYYEPSRFLLEAGYFPSFKTLCSLNGQDLPSPHLTNDNFDDYNEFSDPDSEYIDNLPPDDLPTFDLDF